MEGIVDGCQLVGGLFKKAKRSVKNGETLIVGVVQTFAHGGGSKQTLGPLPLGEDLVRQHQLRSCHSQSSSTFAGLGNISSSASVGLFGFTFHETHQSPQPRQNLLERVPLPPCRSPRVLSIEITPRPCHLELSASSDN
jgi:hypothetical protein